jgi:hypothetical protein
MWVAMCQRYVRAAEAEQEYAVSATQVRHVQSAAREGSKNAVVYNMLTRLEGCTRKEVCEACGWKAADVAGMGRSMGLDVRTEERREGAAGPYGRQRKVLRYFGVPLTPQEMAVAANMKPKPETWEQLAERLGFTDDEKAFWLQRVALFAQPTVAVAAPPRQV